MTSIATLSPQDSHAWQAANQYSPAAEITLFAHIPQVIEAFTRQETDLAIIPVYNTREGEIKEYFRVMEKLHQGYWIDNVVLPVNLSMGALDERHALKMLIGRGSDLRQCEDYISAKLPDISLLIVHDLNEVIAAIKNNGHHDQAVIAPEKILTDNGLLIREREMAPHNQTRFAVLGHTLASPTGYDATALLSAPLKDRVGLLFDILGEFTRRGINLLDLRSETDLKTQKLQIYLETEGHIQDETLRQAVQCIEEQIIQEPGSIKVLGSFPRVDMRKKRINTFGFIGTGEMSRWFADKLENEGYKSLLCGRATALKPAEMIPQVDVVVICVPISATPATIEKYAPLLADGQALILLAGEAENALNTALARTSSGVEIMLVHNLWGPQATTIKDKNAAVVRTPRSGALCSEFEAFLYKHGAAINQDTPAQHDLLIGMGQKLPTTISVALAMTIKENNIPENDINSHSTLTSLYGILAMARIHTQNPRTYAEIMATSGEGRKIVRSFAKNLNTLMDLADNGAIEELGALIETNRDHLSREFLEARMKQALVVDEILAKMIRT